MMAISPSLVSCTSSLMMRVSLVCCDRPRGLMRRRVDHEFGNALAMISSISKRRFARFEAAVMKMKIIFPREAHAAVDLNAAVGDVTCGIARIHLRDGRLDARVGHIFFEGPGGVVNGRSG